MIVGNYTSYTKCFLQQFDSELNSFQCWKRIHISWMIVGNYTFYTKCFMQQFDSELNSF